MLSNKGIINEKIILVRNVKVISNNDEIAEVLNNFFSRAIKTLEISKNVYFDLFLGDFDCPKVRAIVKYLKHLTMLAITKKWKKGKSFYFLHAKLEEVFKEIKLEMKAKKQIFLGKE